MEKIKWEACLRDMGFCGLATLSGPAAAADFFWTICVDLDGDVAAGSSVALVGGVLNDDQRSAEIRTGAMEEIVAAVRYLCAGAGIEAPLRGEIAELVQADRAAEAARKAEACPGCSCKPGEGRTAGCSHPLGCGVVR